MNQYENDLLPDREKGSMLFADVRGRAAQIEVRGIEERFAKPLRLKMAFMPRRSGRDNDSGVSVTHFEKTFPRSCGRTLATLRSAARLCTWGAFVAQKPAGRHSMLSPSRLYTIQCMPLSLVFHRARGMRGQMLRRCVSDWASSSPFKAE